jgi:hypothetical protein
LQRRKTELASGIPIEGEIHSAVAHVAHSVE